MLNRIEIDQKNIIHNVQTIRSLLSPTTKLIAVIKGNAYGHDQNICANILEPYVDMFAVDDIDELRKLRQVSDKSTLLLGYIAQNELEEALHLNATLCLYDIERIKIVNEISKRQHIRTKIHIKIDVLLGRQGVLPSELNYFLTQIHTMKHIEIDGVYTHFSNVEDTDDTEHAIKQINQFKKAIRKFYTYGYVNIHPHISATSGILTYESSIICNPIVRCGIGLYGLWPADNLKKQHHSLTLKPALRWISHIAQVKILPPGHTIGYGLTYITEKNTRIAIIPQGYSDGYDRGLSNCGEVLIHGKRCKVLGRIAMNMFVVDVSEIDDVKCEDEVVLLGNQENECITAEEFAEKLGTINYEVTTRINPLLPRLIT